MIPNLKVGQKLTIIHIDDMMAMTHRKEVAVKSVLEPTKVGYQGEATRVGTYAVKGKRKEFYLDLKPDTLVFDGHDLPLRVDTDAKTGVMCGNACFNFIGDKATVREYVVNRQLNTMIRDSTREKVLVKPANMTGVLDHDEGEPVFPDLAAKSGHAVLRRIVGKAV